MAENFYTWSRCDLEAEVDATIVTIDATIAALDALKIKRLQLLSAINEKALINRILPDDVLVDIFDLSHNVGEDYQDNFRAYRSTRRYRYITPLAVSGVCKSWRALAWAHSHLWRRLEIFDMRGGYNLNPPVLELVSQWLTRSKTQPLNIQIDDRLGVCDNKLCAILLEAAPYWRTFDMKQYGHRSQLSNHFEGQSFPLLEFFSVDGDQSDDEYASKFVWHLEGASRLWSVNITPAIDNSRPQEIPYSLDAYTLNWGSIRVLEVAQQTDLAISLFEETLPSLSKVKAELFEPYEAIDFGRIASEYSDFPFALPHLREMHLVNNCKNSQFSDVLKSFSYPSLRILILEDLYTMNFDLEFFSNFRSVLEHCKITHLDISYVSSNDKKFREVLPLLASLVNLRILYDLGPGKRHYYLEDEEPEPDVSEPDVSGRIIADPTWLLESLDLSSQEMYLPNLASLELGAFRSKASYVTDMLEARSNHQSVKPMKRLAFRSPFILTQDVGDIGRKLESNECRARFKIAALESGCDVVYIPSSPEQFW